MSDAATIVRAAIPNASDALIDHVLWGRTCFPFGKVTARDLYRAASRIKRAADRGRILCELCDNVTDGDSFTCRVCADALSAARATP